MGRRFWLLGGGLLVFLVVVDAFLFFQYRRLRRSRQPPPPEPVELLSPQSEVAGWRLEATSSAEFVPVCRGSPLFVVDRSAQRPALVPVEAKRVRIVLVGRKQPFNLVGVMGEPGAAMGSELEGDTVVVRLWIADRLLAAGRPENLNRHFVADIVARALFLTCEGRGVFEEQPPEVREKYLALGRRFVLEKL